MPVKKPLTLRPDGHFFPRFEVFSPAAATLEEMVDPGFWANVAKDLRPGAVVTVMAEDASWRAEFVVRATSRLEALVAVLRFDRFGDAAEALDTADPYVARWHSPKTLYGVFKAKGGECVKNGFETKEAAQEWARSHEKAMAA